MKANRRCLNCGGDYYVCCGCVSKNSWKRVCCSSQCYQAYMSKIDKKEKTVQKEQIIEMDNSIVMKVKTHANKTYDIIGCDYDLGRFDTPKGKTLLFEDIKEFVIPADELKDLCRLLVECKNSKLEEQLAKEAVEEPVVEPEPIVEVADVEPEVEVEVLNGGDINEYKLED